MSQMSYNSLSFLLFFAAFLLVYLVMPKAVLRQAVVLLGNFIFYYYAGGRSLLVLVLAASLVVYFVSLLIGRIYGGYETEAAGLKPKEKSKLLAAYKKRAKKYVAAAIVLLLAVLVWGKAGRLLGWREVQGFTQLGAGTFLVPLGISYYTFSAVGYLLDLYWRKAKTENNFLLLLVSMTYFPTIVQGPISRYDKLMKQFRELPGFSYDRVMRGLQRMVWGYFKKMVVADRISIYTSAVFGDISNFAGVEVILAVAGSALYLYADFSGCMDIVIGAAEAMGVTLDENFQQPFFSKGAAEFWRRWHITLGAWFKDYVYMPIATSPGMMKRTSEIRKRGWKRRAQFFQTAVPLIVVWVLTGLWHGTGADYLIWGVYWGVLIIVETTFASEFKKVNEFLHVREDSFGHRLFQMMRTFVYFGVGRMITALGYAGSVQTLFRRMFAELRPWTLFDGSLYQHGLDQKDSYVMLAGIAVIWAVSILQTKMNVRERIAEQNLVLRWAVYLGGIFAIVIFGMYGPGYSAGAFVYGGF